MLGVMNDILLASPFGGDGPILSATLKNVTASTASLALPAFLQMPPTCAVYFTPDKRVGRKCRVTAQDNLNVSVAFEGRITCGRQKTGSHLI
jgi:hypothetical protein